MSKQSITLPGREGFTIIEVVLVLAIAGLIFLMVFVALPALQRSQRDTQRRNDVSRVSTSLVQYQTNNSTSANPLPAATNFPASDTAFDFSKTTCAAGACTFVRDYLNAAGSTTNTFQDPNGKYYGVKIMKYDASKNTYATLTSGSSKTSMDYTIYIITGAKCNGEAVASDTSRHFAILYRLEGAGTYCLDDQ